MNIKISNLALENLELSSNIKTLFEEISFLKELNRILSIENINESIRHEISMIEFERYILVLMENINQQREI